jgi:hypothetical protein
MKYSPNHSQVFTDLLIILMKAVVITSEMSACFSGALTSCYANGILLVFYVTLSYNYEMQFKLFDNVLGLCVDGLTGDTDGSNAT